MGAAVAIVLSLIGAYIIYKIEQSRFSGQDDFDYYDDEEDEYEELDESDTSDNYFDFLTVNEQFAEAKVTNDELVVMQGLIRDLSMCSVDNQLILQISWSDSDGNTNTYDLYCDGLNAATECISQIAKREIVDLRSTLSDQCSRLAMSTKSAPLFIRNTNAERKNIRKRSGEGLESGSETVLDVRKDN